MVNIFKTQNGMNIVGQGEKTMTTLNASTDGMLGSAVTRHAPVRRGLLTCGILSSLLYVAATILGAMVWVNPAENR